MVRSLLVAVLILAGAALGAMLLCVLALRVLLATTVAVSGIRRRMAHGARLLDW